MSADAIAAQGEFEFYDPLEPRVMPQDGAAWFTINRAMQQRQPDGNLVTRLYQSLYPLRRYADLVTACAGAPDTYVSQGIFGAPLRRVTNLKWATHAYVDVDTYNDGDLQQLTPREMVNELLWYCDDNDIPRPSVILSSGRGYYLKWFWSQAIPQAEVGRATAVNRALVRRLAPFKPDPKVIDLARILRIRHTVNSKNNRTVEIVHLAGTEDAPLTYDFDTFARDILATAVEPDVSLPGSSAFIRPAMLPGRRPSRFSREEWHWGVLEDLRKLAALRYPGGIVEPGMRDLFGHLAACQLARVVPADVLFREITAVARSFLPPGYIDRELRGHSSALLSRAALAAKGELVEFGDGCRTPIYLYSKSRMIEVLEITPAEEPHMTRLISDAEKYRRRLAARRAAGLMPRETYEARAAGRRRSVVEMRTGSMSWRAIAAELGISVSQARRLAV